MKELLETVVLLALAAVFIARTPTALRSSRGRPAWIASGVGTLALFTLGTIIPQPVLDASLGGTNVIKLVQTLLATTAFWFLRRAALQQANIRSSRDTWRILIGFLVVLSVSFFFIDDRGATTHSFLVDHINQPSAWFYACAYMLGVGAMAGSLAIRLRRRKPRTYWLFISGATAVSLASAVEIIALTLDHFEAPTPLLRSVTYILFDPLFYSGILFIIAGISSFVVRKWVREIGWRFRARKLAAILDRHGELSTSHPTLSTNSCLIVPNIVGLAYELLIAIRDRQITQQIILAPVEEKRVATAERKLATQIGQPVPLGEFDLESRPT